MFLLSFVNVEFLVENIKQTNFIILGLFFGITVELIFDSEIYVLNIIASP